MGYLCFERALRLGRICFEGDYMWLLTLVSVAAFLFWRSNKRRAKRFVRAVHFLDLVRDGASANEANGLVALMFTSRSTADEDNAAIRYAAEQAKMVTDGKQLPWIHMARQQGFAVDSGNTRFDMAHLSTKHGNTNQD